LTESFNTNIAVRQGECQLYCLT